jgi:lipid-A-disaccharide synthase
MKDHLNIMIVAGEASGDSHAARLVNAIERQHNNPVNFFGSAGPKMRDSGVEAIVRADELSVMGLAEIGSALPMFYRAFRTLKDEATKRKPDVAVLVDFPDFNLRLAKKLKKRGIKVVYYISPQLWAWRSYRIKTVKKYVDLMLTILPFERDWYLANGVEHVEYVGNPLVREVHASVSREAYRAANGISGDEPLIALLPGSRRTEIHRILPDMVNAAKLLAGERPQTKFVIASAAHVISEQIVAMLHELDPEKQLDLRLVEGETYDVLNACDAAAIASGTATLEAGILNVPMAVVYKTSSTNYRLLEPLINAEHYALVNLLARRRIVAELIQNDFTPQKLADELERLLQPSVNRQIRTELKKAASQLGEGGASKRAAEFILELLRK